MSKIEDNIVPIKIAYLAEFVAEKKRISLQDALTYIYSNPMSEELYDERAKWWYLDTESLYNEFEKRRKTASKGVEFRAFEFYVYCLEQFAKRTGLTSLQVMALFDRYGADDYILDNYDLLHTQGIGLVLDDVEHFIDNRR